MARWQVLWYAHPEDLPSCTHPQQLIAAAPPARANGNNPTATKPTCPPETKLMLSGSKSFKMPTHNSRHPILTSPWACPPGTDYLSPPATSLLHPPATHLILALPLTKSQEQPTRNNPAAPTRNTFPNPTRNKSSRTLLQVARSPHPQQAQMPTRNNLCCICHPYYSTSPTKGCIFIPAPWSEW